MRIELFIIKFMKQSPKKFLVANIYFFLHVTNMSILTFAGCGDQTDKIKKKKLEVGAESSHYAKIKNLFFGQIGNSE